MSNLKLVKKVFAIMLAFILIVNCFVINSTGYDSVEAAKSAGYTKTFENATEGGILYIKDTKGKVLKKLKEGDSITYEYPSAKARDEIFVEAVAEDGYVVSSYLAMWLLDGEKRETCESVYNLNKKKYKRSHYLATAEYDEVFTVSFVRKKEIGNENVEDVPRVFASSDADIDNPKVGDVYTGKAELTYNGKKTSSYNGTGYITCTSGEFEGEQITLVNCASGSDHWAPQTGQTGTYKITITKINKNTGKITCKVEWENSKYTEGYQNLSGTFSYTHSFDGEFILFKEMGEAEGSFVMNSSIEGRLDLNATFGVYGEKSCKKKILTLKTDEKGKCNTEVNLAPGTYYVKELVAPKGFALNPTVFKVKIGASSAKMVTVKDNVLRARISGVKIDSRTGQSVPSFGLSLAGATYVIYEDEACMKSCTTGISDANGNIEFDIEYLAYGTYYIKETKPPEGYKKDPNVYKIVVDESLGYFENSTYRLNDVSFTSIEEPEFGKGKIIKKSANESLTNGNSCYSLAGCKFQLTNMRTNEVVSELLVTDVNGITQEIELPVGTYMVKEVEAPKGFTLNPEEMEIEIMENQTSSVTVYDEPTNDPVGVLLKKVDKETGTEVATGAGELAGAEYTFKYYDGQYTTVEELADIVPTRTWVFATDEEGFVDFRIADKISGDEFYFDSIGNRVIPLGTLTIQETKAPEGYNMDETLYIQNFTTDSSGSIIQSYQTAISEEKVIRGDIKGKKVAAGNQKPLANVPFQITSVESGESHIVVTDENGIFDTSSGWNLHSTNTNQGKTSKDGVWFGDVTKLDDNVGALPYGKYRIEELPCEANADKILIEPFEIVVSEHNEVINLGTIVNEYVPIPKISTKATDKNTGLQITYADKETTIADVVDYKELTIGETYTLKGILMDKSTEKPLLVNDKEVTVEKTFTTKETYGSVEMDYTFDSSELRGKDVVVFEYLYQDGKEIAKHADINDKNQTVHFANPTVQTSASEKSSGKKMIKVSEKTAIADKVVYCNLIPGKQHTIKGVVMDKETEKPLLVNGKQVTAEYTFIAKTENGSIDVTFTFDSTDLEGKSVVIYERLYCEGELIAFHADINDDNQTVTFEDKEEPPTTEEPPKTKTPNKPKTGDSVNVVAIVILLIASVAGLVFILIKRKKG